MTPRTPEARASSSKPTVTYFAYTGQTGPLLARDLVGLNKPTCRARSLIGVDTLEVGSSLRHSKEPHGPSATIRAPSGKRVCHMYSEIAFSPLSILHFQHARYQVIGLDLGPYWYLREAHRLRRPELEL